MIGREPSQSISQNGRIEIHEQTDGQSRKPQVRDHLRFVNRQQAFDRFELEQDAFFDDQIEPITAIKSHSLVVDGKRSLLFELEPALGQLGAYTCLVGGFQQSWTQMPMHFDERTDYLVRPIIKSSDLPFTLG